LFDNVEYRRIHGIKKWDWIQADPEAGSLINFQR